RQPAASSHQHPPNDLSLPAAVRAGAYHAVPVGQAPPHLAPSGIASYRKRVTSPLILFDLDGTLLDTAPDLVAALNIATAPEGLRQLTVEEARAAVGHVAKGLSLLALRSAERAADDDVVERVIRRFLVHYEANLADATRPFPGVIEALDRLAARGMPLAVCTNKREHLARLVL